MTEAADQMSKPTTLEDALAELDLAYMSITTLKAQVGRLEAENARLLARSTRTEDTGVPEASYDPNRPSRYSGGFGGPILDEDMDTPWR